ncbi:MAG: hypothetical protein WBP79_09065 [Candidatus Acidiferrales bacterium]
MRSLFTTGLVAVLVVSLLDLPVRASGAKPLGIVIQSQSARLDNTVAAMGTTVYPGDALSTDTGGMLRLKFGSGQLYLFSASSAKVAQESSGVQATILRGTAAFSSSEADQLSLLLPEGILRAANDKPAYGQVTIVGPNVVIIAAMRGSLILDNEGELHTIGAGSSYRVTMVPEPGDDVQSPTRARKRRRLIVALIIFGGAAIASGLIYNHYSESPSKPN